MRVTIYQPQYFPRLHYFNRIVNGDVFVVLESAQFVRVLQHKEKTGKVKHKSYQVHSPLKLPHGLQFITVPVNHDWYNPINKTQINFVHNWRKKHLRTIEMAYKKALNFDSFFPQIENILYSNYETLSHLNLKTILWGLSVLFEFNLKTEELKLGRINKLLKKVSNIRLNEIILDKDVGEISLSNSRQPNEWIVSICKQLKANELLHGETSKAGYMDTSFFERNGIKSVVQKWKLKDYTQQHFREQEFLKNLSILDLLMNVDSNDAKKILI